MPFTEGNALGVTHGKSKTREYAIWKQMRQRCSNPLSSGYKDYGAKGIKVCQSWQDSFEKFLEDMGVSPADTSLDRIDVTGDYCRDNCRWASQSIQNFNQNIRVNNNSGRTGVSWDTQRSKWFVRICIDGKNKNLGRFSSYEKAVEVRELAELEFYGFTKK